MQQGRGWSIYRAWGKPSDLGAARPTSHTHCAELRLGHQEQKLLPGRNGELKLAHRTTFGEASLKLGARTKNTCIEAPAEARRAGVVVATHGGLPGGEAGGAKGVPDGLRH